MKRRDFVRRAVWLTGTAVALPLLTAKSGVATGVDMAKGRDRTELVLCSGHGVQARMRQDAEFMGWDVYDETGTRGVWHSWVSDSHLVELGLTPEEYLGRWVR